MKKLVILTVALTVLVACHKNKNNNSTPTNPAATGYSWIYNWHDGDTMVGYKTDMQTPDTVYSFLHGDTTGIYYHGQKLYLYMHAGRPHGLRNSYYYSDSAEVWDCMLGPVPFDSTNIWTLCQAGGHQHFDLKWWEWGYNPQFIDYLSDVSHFDSLYNEAGWSGLEGR